MSTTERPCELTMFFIRIKVKGRRGLCTLMHFTATNVTAALSVVDPSYVAILR